MELMESPSGKCGVDSRAVEELQQKEAAVVGSLCGIGSSLSLWYAAASSSGSAAVAPITMYQGREQSSILTQLDGEGGLMESRRQRSIVNSEHLIRGPSPH